MNSSIAMKALRPILLVMLVVGSCSIAAPMVRAHGLSGPKIPRFSLSLGGSVGAFVAKDITAASVTIDLTGAWSIFWLSAGLRGAFQTESTHLLPYAEAGVWYYANLGVGYSVGQSFGGDDTPRMPRHNVHIFVGVPIPVWMNDGNSSHTSIVYLEPYYRPQWGSGDGARGWSHEVGLMFKWLLGRGSAWSRK